MRRPIATTAVLAVLTFLLVTPTRAYAQIWPFGKKGNKEQYKSFQSPSQRYSVEYPSDWQPQPGGTGAVVFTQKKSEATVSIEYETLAVALEASDINDATAGYEIDHIKSQLPKADGFKKDIRTENGRRVIVIEYNRPAVTGGVERARQYSLIVGKDVYRINCSAAPALFDKYESVFSHALTSFKAAGTAP